MRHCFLKFPEVIKKKISIIFQKKFFLKIFQIFFFINLNTVIDKNVTKDEKNFFFILTMIIKFLEAKNVIL